MAPRFVSSGVTTARLVTGELSTRRLPRWLPLLLIPLLAVPLALWFLRPPSSLAEAQLVGARGPGCLRLVLAADMSGSMTQLAAPRASALAELLAWLPANLRSGDELAVVEFASATRVMMPPTGIFDSPQVDTTTAASTDIGGGTALAPLLAAVGGFPASRCLTALVILGDGAFNDQPATPDDALVQFAAARVHEVRLLVPGNTATGSNWAEVMPFAPVDTFDGLNAGATSMTIARAVAELTHQQLTRKSVS